MVEKILRNSILKQNQSADLQSFSDWLYKFEKNFRLAIMNFALPLKKTFL